MQEADGNFILTSLIASSSSVTKLCDNSSDQPAKKHAMVRDLFLQFRATIPKVFKLPYPNPDSRKI